MTFPSYRVSVALLVLVWGILDTATAMYAVSLNWLWESGALLSWLLKSTGAGVEGWGPLLILVTKGVAALAILWMVKSLEGLFVTAVGRLSLLLAAILSLYGPFSNLMFILKIEHPQAHSEVSDVLLMLLQLFPVW